MSYLPLKFESSNIFPKEIIAIRPDVHIMVSSGIFSNNTKRQSGTTAPVFELSYTRKNFIYGEVNRVPVELRPGYSSLGFLGEACSQSEYSSGEEVQLYSIWVSPYTFDGSCEAVYGKSNIGFHSFQKDTYSCCGFKSDAREESIINKLDMCFIKEANQINRLLLESYVLELLSINIERLICIDSSREYESQLSRADMDSLAYAREILLNRLESPPTLLELSRIIHMNDCKLKRSFKQYFGKTVYEFIREQRLEKAFALLEQGKHNVSESAFAVGYTNVSHFSEAFQKKFGIPPRLLIR
ncbi:transcriptional regulator, AraC family [Lacrimispora sphenoides]|jgi:AraC-like DNA-binding protein|uniref:helix-turn-helix domain-containing protein n=1 Tax=Lacrimispora sphenoides TaxID=29370 RepID=UPI0008B26778|nr:AraC family transcriptional regulator [Lacrimispora sphenoides]SET96256.1 transcriptional regulator, AraC family [Lacrimispora sphenoides]